MFPSIENRIRNYIYRQFARGGVKHSLFVVIFLFLLWFSTLFLIVQPLTMHSIQARNINTTNEVITKNNIDFTPLARYPHDKNTRAVGFAMRDNFIYSNIRDNPTILDVSNISNPTFVAEYEVGENKQAYSLALRDEYLYHGYSSMFGILNISNLASPTFAGRDHNQ